MNDEYTNDRIKNTQTHKLTFTEQKMLNVTFDFNQFGEPIEGI